jgi:diaphanous 1
MITHIAYSLHGSNAKLRALVTIVLAAISFISVQEGHKAVISALSDFRIEFSEVFRFEGLIASLRLPEVEYGDGSPAPEAEEEGIWEARTAVMSLINAITTSPDTLEDRILMRDEFTRRGLNEVMVVSIAKSGVQLTRANDCFSRYDMSNRRSPLSRN